MHQLGLADPCLSTEDEDRALTGPDALEQAIELLALPTTPDESGVARPPGERTTNVVPTPKPSLAGRTRVTTSARP